MQAMRKPFGPTWSPVDAANSILLGAARWLQELSVRDEDSARLSLRTQSRFRDLTPTQYEIALDWLRSKDLYPSSDIDESWNRTPGARVLGAAIEGREPSWLPDADSLIREPSDLPLDVVGLGQLLAMDPEEMYDEVHRVWRKFDDSAQRALGACGERAFMRWLENNVAARVVHVSDFDDTAGFDIALVVGGRVRARIEVKSTRREDSTVLFLSRNEIETMRRRSDWCLQVVHLDASDGFRFLSWVTPETILAGEPRDGPLATWQSMRMTLPASALQPGVPPPVEALLSRS